MGLDDGHRHDVEDAAGVGVFRVSEFVVATACIVGRLDLAVDLTAIRAFEVNDVPAVRLDGAADGRVGDLLFRDLFDVERSTRQVIASRKPKIATIVKPTHAKVGKAQPSERNKEREAAKNAKVAAVRGHLVCVARDT